MFCWHLFDADKNILTKNDRVSYKDTLSRYGEVFSRIRLYPKSCIAYDQGKIYITEGQQLKYLDYGYIQTRWLLRKHGNTLEQSMLRSDGYFSMQMDEYQLEPYYLNGVPLIKGKIRTATVADSIWPRTCAETKLLELIGLHYPACLTQLGLTPWKTMYPTEATSLFSGTEVWADIQSPYATKVETEFLWRAYVGSFLDNRFNAAVQTAYVNAAKALPKVASNGIANVLELASMLSALLRRDFDHVSSKIGDMWLAYRYAICTTLLDVSEYQGYVERIINLAGSPVSDVKTHGYFTDGGWTFHVVLTVSIESIIPSSVEEQLKAFGLEMNAVNAWDMIPYSFIVDWFLPISDTLSLWEESYKSRNLPVTEAWCSVTSPNGDCFMRAPTAWASSYPLLESQEVSKKTLFMRIADAIALLR